MSAPKNEAQIHLQSCIVHGQFQEIIDRLDATVAFTTYQAGKIFFVGTDPKTGATTQLLRTFSNPMGLALRGDMLALGDIDSIQLFRNVPVLAASYPKKPDTYDAMFLPRTRFQTGSVHMHDIELLEDGSVLGVNTAFSCLCLTDGQDNFRVVWKPPFVSDVVPEDRCHLNGMAFDQGQVRYLTALGTQDTPGGWRQDKLKGGVVLEYPSGKVLAQGLAMPHSPRLWQGRLFLLLSAIGQLVEMDLRDGSIRVVAELGGFARGMDIVEGYAFIGLSKMRHMGGEFSELPTAQRDYLPGICVVELASGKLVAQLEYSDYLDEVYEVRLLRGLRRPNLLTSEDEQCKSAVAIEGFAYWGKLRDESLEGTTTDVTRAGWKDLQEQHPDLLVKHFAHRVETIAPNLPLSVVRLVKDEKVLGLSVVKSNTNGLDASLLSIKVQSGLAKPEALLRRLLDATEAQQRLESAKRLNAVMQSKDVETPELLALLSGAGWPQAFPQRLIIKTLVARWQDLQPVAAVRSLHQLDARELESLRQAVAWAPADEQPAPHLAEADPNLSQFIFQGKAPVAWMVVAKLRTEAARVKALALHPSAGAALPGLLAAFAQQATRQRVSACVFSMAPQLPWARPLFDFMSSRGAIQQQNQILVTSREL